jgi:hypothetical protein
VTRESPSDCASDSAKAKPAAETVARRASRPQLPLFFVHIPKTAGTSFRLGAEEFFGKARIVYDYGVTAPQTDPLVRAALYQERQDFWALRQACERQGAAMIAGHVGARRFASLFGVARTITFLRNPVQRVASEYVHLIDRGRYKGSFRDFFSRPAMHNRLSKVMSGIDQEAFGFVGLTERYPETIEMLNQRYDVGIRVRQDNRRDESRALMQQLSSGELEELVRLNKQDLRLFEMASDLFEARLDLFRRGETWSHARLTSSTSRGLSGYAWWAANRDEPVEVEVWINGEAREQVAAVELRPDLCHLLPPRGGYVGFRLPIKLSPGDRVQCRVVPTGQWFPLKPQQVPALEKR